MDIALHPRQMFALLTEAQELLYGGAAGGGKSHLLRVAALVYSVWVPGLQTYIFRKTYKELIANHIHTPGGFPQLTKEMRDDKLITWNKSDNSFDFANGSRIQLAHCQYDSDVNQYLGAQIQFLAIDESTHLSAHVYKFLRSRVRMGSLAAPKTLIKSSQGNDVTIASLFPRILACSNPGNISHNFWKREFVDHGEDIWRAPAMSGGMTRQYIPSRVDDNPTLIKNDPGYKDRIRGMGHDHLVSAILDGDWSIIAGGALDDLWDREVHVIKPFKIPRGWRIDRSYDYGSSAPYAVLWFAESNGEEFYTEDGEVRWFPKNTLFCIMDLYGATEDGQGLAETPDDTARKVLEMELEAGLRGRVVAGPADRSIFDTDRGPSIADLMSKVGVRWREADKRPGSRVNGLNIIRQFLNNSIANSTAKVAEKAGFYCFSTCHDFIKYVPTVPRDEKKIEDVDTKSDDHMYDAFRYRVLASKSSVSFSQVVGI